MFLSSGHVTWVLLQHFAAMELGSIRLVSLLTKMYSSHLHGKPFRL